MRSNWRLIKELLMRPNGNESVNFVVLYFSFALNDGYKFHVFFPQILVLLFSHRRIMGSHILHSSIGLGG